MFAYTQTFSDITTPNIPFSIHFLRRSHIILFIQITRHFCKTGITLLRAVRDGFKMLPHHFPQQSTVSKIEMKNTFNVAVYITRITTGMKMNSASLYYSGYEHNQRSFLRHILTRYSIVEATARRFGFH